MDLGLRGRIALINAASRGLGLAAARALGAEGASVAITARGGEALRQAAEEIQSASGAAVLPIVADMTSAGDIERAVTQTVERFGGLDILVTNAGGPKPGTFATITERDWRDAFELTLMSVVRLATAAVPHMRRRGGGRIINITSVSARQPVDGLLLSNSLRAAVVGFAKSLATELAAEGILVTSVAPGYMRTDRAVELAGDMARREGVPTADVERRLVQQVPLRRMGQPAELGAVIAFLASERASYLTGVSIVVDGGLIRCV